MWARNTYQCRKIENGSAKSRAGRIKAESLLPIYGKQALFLCSYLICVALSERITDRTDSITGISAAASSSLHSATIRRRRRRKRRHRSQRKQKRKCSSSSCRKPHKRPHRQQNAPQKALYGFKMHSFMPDKQWRGRQSDCWAVPVRSLR